MRHEGASGFLAAVDDITWWLGDVALLFRSGQSVDMLWYPGSDGAFVHIGGARELLVFRVVPALQEVGVVLGWAVVVD